jgi:hypothetical protein
MQADHISLLITAKTRTSSGLCLKRSVMSLIILYLNAECRKKKSVKSSLYRLTNRRPVQSKRSKSSNITNQLAIFQKSTALIYNRRRDRQTKNQQLSPEFKQKSKENRPKRHRAVPFRRVTVTIEQ